MKKYLLLTFGCQMNKSDSERIESILAQIGWQKASQEHEADFVLFNTCSVRQKAEDRIYGLVTKFSKIRKEEKKDMIIGVTGCMVGRDLDGSIKKRMTEVDLFFDISEMKNLPKFLEDIEISRGKAFTVPQKIVQEIDLDYLEIAPKYTSQFQAFIPIQSGCNQFCSYCVVPFARGKQVNRKTKDILSEIRTFAEQGGKEVTLLGQNVNTFEVDERQALSKKNPYTVSFAQLLWETNQIDGIERVHFTAPHPNYMQDEVIDALSLPKHVNYLHLPVQSGSNKILKKMNRDYTREDYITLVEKIKAKNPSICLGTDIIVGFCGETKEDFNQTLDLYKTCEFDISYTAEYSPRSGTLSYKAFKDDVSLQEKKERWNTLQELMNSITYKKNQKFHNQKISVLFDTYDEEKKTAFGWSKDMKKVRVQSDVSLNGHILNVKVKEAHTWIFDGEIAEKIALSDLSC